MVSRSKIRLQSLVLASCLALLVLFTTLAFINPWDEIPYWAVDFSVYHAAASALAHGQNPYVLANLEAYAEPGSINTLLAYSYPPLLAELLIPLTLLQVDTAARLWLGLNLMVPVATIALLLAASGWKPRPVTLALLLLGALLFVPCLYTYLSGQASLWSLFWASAAIVATQRKQALTAGIAWVLAWVKPHPLLLIPLDMLNRNRTGLALFALILVTSIMLAFPFVPSWVEAVERSLTSNASGDGIYYQAAILAPLSLLGPIGLAFRMAALIAAAGAILWLNRTSIGWKPRTVAVITLSLLISPYMGRSDAALSLIPLTLILSERRRGPAAVAVVAWGAPIVAFMAIPITGLRILALPLIWSSLLYGLLAIAAAWYVLSEVRSVSLQTAQPQFLPS